MPRVKRGTSHTKKRRTLLKKVKGYKWGRKKLIKVAKTATLKAGVHAYTDRRLKKRDNRGLWQTKIGAFLKLHDWSYSRFIDALHKADIALDRKILADLAVNNQPIMTKLVDDLKKQAK